MLPIVTAFYAGILALGILALAARVGLLRQAHGVSVGDGGQGVLVHAIRAHGNAVETVPLALLLIGLAEILGAPVAAVHALGLTLLTGRILHAVYFLTGATRLVLRGLGMLLTVAAIGLAALGLIGHAATDPGLWGGLAGAAEDPAR